MFRFSPYYLSACARTQFGLGASALLVVWLAASEARAVGLVYVDAVHGVSGNLTPSSAIDVNPTAASRWDLRPRQTVGDPSGPLGSGGHVYESSAQNAAELKMSVGGVTAGASYDLYAVYWSDVGATENWTIRAGTVTGLANLQLFDRLGTLGGATQGTLASTAYWSTPPFPNKNPNSLFTESDTVGNRVMLLGKFGTVTADGGALNAFFDDFSQTTSKNRVWLDGLAYAPAGTPVFLSATVERTTGELTLNNLTGGSFQVKSCTVTSAGGALDATQWNPLNDDPLFVEDDAWSLTAPANPAATPFATALTETEAPGAATIGGAFASVTALNLGPVWRPTPIEDISISLTLADDSVVTLKPSYTGALAPGDLNGDGEVDLADYASLRAHLHTSAAGITRAEAFTRGDMNVDQAINVTDFRLFRAAYDSAHGLGALDAALAVVPEPGGMALVCGALAIGAAWRRRELRRAVVERRSALLAASVAAACLASGGSAAPLANWQIDGLLNGSAPVLNAGTASPSLGDGTANSADNAAIYAAFPVQQLADGQQIALSGKLTLSGATAAPEQLRFGLFKDDDDPSSPFTGGWRGHLAQAGDGATAGSMASRTPGSAGFNNASFMQTTGFAATLANTTVDPESQRLLDDEYDFNFTLRRFGNELEIVGSLVGALGFQNYWDSVTETDLSRIAVNFEYDRAGFLAGDGLNADRVTFSNVDLTVGPITSLVLQVNVANGAMRIVNNGGAPVNLAYYEVTSDAGSLNAGGWKSLDDQEGGDPVGVGWDEIGENTSGVLSEIHLGAVPIAQGGLLGLGQGFTTGFSQDLEFRYIHDSGIPLGTLIRGAVQYVNITPGDFTVSSGVNGADFTKWKGDFGPGMGSDAEWDGDSDGADFLAWQRNFGAPAATAVGAPVPEPATWGTWALVGASALAGRRRERQGRA